MINGYLSEDFYLIPHMNIVFEHNAVSSGGITSLLIDSKYIKIQHTYDFHDVQKFKVICRK